MTKQQKAIRLTAVCVLCVALVTAVVYLLRHR